MSMGGREAGAASGDLAGALRCLASGRSVADVWKETGYASKTALIEEIDRLADRLAPQPRIARSGAGAPAGGAGVRAKAAAKGDLSVIAYSDGASSGNPGDAGCGVVILSRSGEVLLEDYRYIGRTTNNVAEYEGALLALTRARELGATGVVLKVDSELLANQIKGVYKVKSANLTSLYQDVKELERLFEKLEVILIGRSDNKQADRLANLAIESHKKRIARSSESPE